MVFSLLLTIFACTIALELLPENKSMPLDTNNINRKSTEYTNQLKTAGNWYETSVISIDGDAEGVDAHNWTWVGEQAWFGGGTGIVDDPYLLENISISVDSASPGLTIQDSGVFFNLNNVTVTNINVEGNGIYLYNVENGTLNDVNLLDNGLDGILMQNVNFTDLTDITATGNGDDGIQMTWSVVNTITTSNISENTGEGLYMANSTLNEILSSYFQTNGEDGICAEDSDLNVFIIESDSNIFNGLQLIDSDNCTIILSEFWDNTIAGVLLIEDDGDTKDNYIYGNTFSGNGENGVDNATTNYWDNGAIGNNWDDYSGVDADDNTIGDTPYLVGGSAGAEDNYPYCNDGDESIIVVVSSSSESDEDEILDSFYFEKSIILCILGISLALFTIKRIYSTK